MATVIEKPDPAAKFATKVDEQLAEATSRIRGHDLALGGLFVAGLVLGYAAAMMLLDRYLVVAEWLRQLSLLAFVGVVGYAAYRMLVRPLRARVNPMYAAVVVERTIDDAKNSLVGYVEAQERGDVHPAVKAAMGARAAKSVDDADVNRAVDHRGLLYAGGGVIALFLTLVVLFFVFRPTQFQSLLGRTFAPFSSATIASRTTVFLVEPQGGDVTVTSGQSLTIRAEVSGRLPKPDAADKVRLLVRYNPADPAYDELPMEPGETSREWFVQVRPEQLRTGAWYKVAAGDGETAEHRVTVRTAPLFTDFEVEYLFPAYTRRPDEKSTDPHLMAVRNTKVSVVAKANRPVRDGRAVFDPAGQPVVAGKVVPGRQDALRFDFLLTTPGSYRLTFNAADGERSPESMPFGIKLDEDRPPLVSIQVPQPDDIQLPANGLLAIDGGAGDDYGLDKLTLKLKLADVAARPLADRPYLGGKSFRRDADGTYPVNLAYKDSVELGKLTDPAGGKVELKEGMVLEYWLEATDNRTKPGSTGPEPDPQVGKSAVKRVRLLPPLTPPEQKDQEARRDQRKQDEKQHADNQQKQLDNEPRPQPNAPPKADPPQDGMGNPMPMPQDGMGKQQDGTGNPMPMDGMGKKQDGMPMPMGNDGTAKKQDGMPMPMGNDGTGKKQDGMPMGSDGTGMKQDGMGNPNPPKSPEQKNPQDKGIAGGMTDPKMPPTGMNDGTPMPMSKADMGTPGSNNGMPQQAPMPSDPGSKNVQEQANKVQDQLNQEKSGGGTPKAAPTANDGERTPPADQKSNPPMGGMPPEAQPKTDGGMGASEPRTDGKAEQPPEPSQAKAGPTGDMPPMPNKGSNPQPSETRREPLGGDPGAEREPQKGGDPMQKGMSQTKNDPTAGGEPKAASQQKSDDVMGKASQQPTPADNAAKAKTAPPSNDRGGERDPMQKGSPQSEPQGGGEPKMQQPEQPGAVRPMPKEGDPTPMNGMGNDAKGGDPMANAAEPRPAPMGGTKQGDPKMGDPPMGKGKEGEPKGGMAQPKNLDPGMERPEPGNPQQNGGQGQAPMPKSVDPKAGPEAGPMNPMTKAGPENPGAQKGTPPALDPKQKADLEQAAKDLTNPDPNRQKAARDKLDQALGKGAGQKLEDIAKGLNSNDPKEKAAAQQQLDDLRRQAEQTAGKEPGPKGMNPMDMGTAKGMDPTPSPMGTDKGMNPMPQPMDMGVAKGGPKGDTNPKAGPTPKFDPKELEGALNDLNSKDEAKRDAAREKLDKTVGKEARQQAEQLQNDLKSGDPEREARAREKLDQLKQQAEQMAKDNPPGGKGSGKEDRFKEGGGVEPNNAKAMDADPRNRAKSAELTLDQFERNRYNRDLQDRLGWTQEQYDRFLDDYRREVARLQRDATDAERNPPVAAGPPPRPVDINSGGRIEGRPTGAGTAGVGGPTFSAPGFEEAMRRFREGATQRPPAKRP
ncbi:hypothetical protein [Urbifossiella limnaea]|uniref:DUF4175 family protein n=1 Tax=Urbifossiella limnaea TaxID=2528023 RepID=A0A517XVS8_9BACT|nr:hypothetical protein [Urbifossiella limnaea]QDU21587.1 hypothetical protein ETAA1_35570 [Urbifossiella limnaea]